MKKLISALSEQPIRRAGLRNGRRRYVRTALGPRDPVGLPLVGEGLEIHFWGRLSGGPPPRFRARLCRRAPCRVGGWGGTSEGLFSLFNGSEALPLRLDGLGGFLDLKLEIVGLGFLALLHHSADLGTTGCGVARSGFGFWRVLSLFGERGDPAGMARSPRPRCVEARCCAMSSG